MADLSFLKLEEKPLAILGLGISGKAVADACIAANIPYHAWMDDEATREKLKDKYALHDFSNDLSNYYALVPAAGIKQSHPIIQKALDQGIKILSDIDLLAQSAPEATYIGITGTNGKSTTTALIGHILKEANKKIAVGGNIGTAACSLPNLGKDGIYVLELSSYQLEITAQPVCDIAVLTNIAEDHLDWHGDMTHYINAKKKIFQARANRVQTSIIGINNLMTETIAEEIATYKTNKLITVSTLLEPDEGRITVKDGALYDNLHKITALNEHPYLKGQHNYENIAVAYAVCHSLGIDDELFIKALFTFQGLQHRQKLVATYKGISFVNDSKGTNVDSTARALASFDNVYWIVGGIATAPGLDGLESFFPSIRQAFLIGQATERFAAKLEGQVPYLKCDTLDHAIAAAFAAASKDGGLATILLSPASKSFDQYKNFEERGEHFERLTHDLLKKVAA